MTENLRSAWVVWHPDSGEDGPGDGISVWARNPQRAAEKWARDYDIDEYPLSVNKNLEETDPSATHCLPANALPLPAAPEVKS